MEDMTRTTADLGYCTTDRNKIDFWTFFLDLVLSNQRSIFVAVWITVVRRVSLRRTGTQPSTGKGVMGNSNRRRGK